MLLPLQILHLDEGSLSLTLSISLCLSLSLCVCKCTELIRNIYNMLSTHWLSASRTYKLAFPVGKMKLQMVPEEWSWASADILFKPSHWFWTLQNHIEIFKWRIREMCWNSKTWNDVLGGKSLQNFLGATLSSSVGKSWCGYRQYLHLCHHQASRNHLKRIALDLQLKPDHCGALQSRFCKWTEHKGWQWTVVFSA